MLIDTIEMVSEERRQLAGALSASGWRGAVSGSTQMRFVGNLLPGCESIKGDQEWVPLSAYQY